MHDKKKSDSDKTSDHEALVKHVDAMMDPKLPDSPPDAEAPAAREPARESAAEAAPEPEATTPKTAPQLSSKLRKQIAINEVPAKPLKIDKLDELTESIAGKESKAEEPEKDEPEKPEQNDIPKDDGLDDAQTDEAVDDIMAYESDVMLAVADSTAKARNPESGEAGEPEKHHVFSTLFWVFVAIFVILAIGFCVLLVMGDSLTSKLGI